jgi:hypothetical protein
MYARSLIVTASLLGCLAMLVGCQIGPRALRASNAHYSDAVRVSQAEQLLVNLVRLRYRDLPVFLAVTNISTQLELATSGSIGGTIEGGSDSVGLGAGISYSERPTVSFSILGGEAFQKRMLGSLSVGVISLLAESGWRIDRVLRLTVEQLNGLENARSASGPTPALAPEYGEFLEVTSTLEELRGAAFVSAEFETQRTAVGIPIPTVQISGGDLIEASRAGLEFQSSAAQPNAIGPTLAKRKLVLRFSPQSDSVPQAMRIRQLLRLAPDTRKFDIVALEDSSFDPLKMDHPMTQLAVDTRSLMGVLYYLANGVEVPAEHIDAGIVTQTVTATGAPFDWSDLLGDLIHVRWSARRPRDAAVEVKHRGYWFYIADDDESSKSTFVLLAQLFALQAGEISEVKPVLTLPVGR